MPCNRHPFKSSAPAKIILLGEHAVVYGMPAIAAPIQSLRAYACAQPSDTMLSIRSVELEKSVAMDAPLPDDSARPLQQLLQIASGHFGVRKPTGNLVIRSDIPFAGGLGSGAAVSAAAIRALAALFGRGIPNEALNQLVFEMEKIHHGTPSGIDNTVVVYERPVYFERGKDFELLTVERPCHIVIADTGRAAMTREAVGRVRQRYDERQSETEELFLRIGQVVSDARHALECGEQGRLGALMNENHRLLRHLGISSPELDELVDASIAAGAVGAKLSGGGMGGNMIALVDGSTVQAVRRALSLAGAVSVVDFVLN
ncbi:MAG: mevalonate kinase [Chloroflexota bacterium]|nr:mevalonate kinase [Chloroflexota bacterium]